jgi:hypothetical protein
VHLANFVAAMRSRKSSDLACEALDGHHSAAGCHMANVSYRLGKQESPEAMKEKVKAQPGFADALERCLEHLRENGVALDAKRAVLGPWVTYDGKQEKFVGDFADAANALSRRKYREPFVMPKIA